MSPGDRIHVAQAQIEPKKQRPQRPCPFKWLELDAKCTKDSGVCSLQLYNENPTTLEVLPSTDALSPLVTLCPYRFEQRGLIYEWVGKEMLGTKSPKVIGQVGFLENISGADVDHDDGESYDDVGKIDNILVTGRKGRLNWCAMEIQAVYFSGPNMGKEFRFIAEEKPSNLTFPTASRRPDYRSSSTKRLMPQLQIKVPTLRRWGKKMAVVVDAGFFASLGQMDAVKHVSNSDIAWFVVDYAREQASYTIRPKFLRFTTLERAVEGLTGGHPVSQPVFEDRILEKLTASYL